MSLTAKIEQKKRKNYEKLPIAFIKNVGQVDKDVSYYIHGSKGGIYFTQKEVIFSFIPKSNKEYREHLVLRLHFFDANQEVKMEGGMKGSGKINYYRGNDPSKWHTDIPVFEEVKYVELWPGIDLVFRGVNGQIKYDFILKPGASVEDIQFTYKGADKLLIDTQGNLIIDSNFGKMVDEKPVSFQEKGKERMNVKTTFQLSQNHLKENVVHFKVEEEYDPNYPLIIDPGLVYSSYLGGSDLDNTNAIAVDASGNAYITGQTSSPTGTFPIVNAFQPTYGGGIGDVFVTKVNPTGSLVYSSYLGGTAFEDSNSIAVDSSGNAYVTGTTNSNNFPTFNAFQPNKGGPIGDTNGNAFITKIGPTGSLVYSSYYGGDGSSTASSIAVDIMGNAYITGNTNLGQMGTFPILNAFQPTYGGGAVDAFVAKVGPTGSLIYSSFLGGTGGDQGRSIAVDTSGNAYISGVTNSPTGTFPILNAFQPSYGGGSSNAFITKVGPTGSLVYSSYIGGTLGTLVPEDFVSIAVDTSGNAYVTGETSSPTGTFPILNAFQPTFGGATDAFVTKVGPTGSLVYSSYLGGTGFENFPSIAVDASGNAYITGRTDSPTGTFPIVNAFQPNSGGSRDAFVTKVGPNGSLVYSSYLGGNGNDFGRSIAVDAAGNAYVTGETTFATGGTFPILDAFQPSYGGGNTDAFVTQIGPTGSLVYSSYLGGVNDDIGIRIAVDPSGNAYITGNTGSNVGFPIVNAFQPAFGGLFDTFVTKVASTVSCVPNITLTITPVAHSPFSPCPYRITGKVTCSGSPVAGAMVTLTQSFSGTGILSISPASTTTNAAGDYQSALTASKPTNGTVTVTASTIVNGTPISTSVTIPVGC